jgi:hypothetical protein
MAGYSGTPLPQKLGIKPGATVALLHAPSNFAMTLGPLPAGVRPRSRLDGAPLDVAVFFTKERDRLEANFPKLKRAIVADGAVWISWPKKVSGIKSDLDENVVRALGLAVGLVDVKVCAVDDVWSGLKFVVPKADRPSLKSAR